MFKKIYSYIMALDAATLKEVTAALSGFLQKGQSQDFNQGGSLHCWWTCSCPWRSLHRHEFGIKD